MVGYCFMDDSTIILVIPSLDTPLEETVKLAQKGLNIFSGASKSTGGQVSAENTKWYIMDFKWDPEGKWRMEDREATLTLPSQERGN